MRQHTFARDALCVEATAGRRTDIVCLCVMYTTLSASSARNDPHVTYGL